MAEAKQAPVPAAPPPPSNSSGNKPTLFILLAVINMAVVLAVGMMLYMGQKKKEAEPGIDDVIKGEHEQQIKDEKSKEFIGKLVPLETFLVNVAGTRGRKIVKISMELELSNAEVQEEVEKIKPKIRDYIITITSGKTYGEITSKEGKEALREEVKTQLNLFLTKGQINKVFFTDFMVN